MLQMNKLDPIEKTRTYTFPQNEVVVLKEVTQFLARPTNHRLLTADGKLHIVPSGWIHVEIEAEGFTL